MSEQKPSVGRIVHYVSYGTPGGEYPSTCRAAIVTDVGPYSEPSGGHVLGLCVLNPSGILFGSDIEYDDRDAEVYVAGVARRAWRGGTWHWPERV